MAAGMADSRKANAFQDATLPHLRSAFVLARWLTRDEHDAEDLVQEAYLRAYRYFESFDGRSPRAWLLSIVRNVFYTAQRRRLQQAPTISLDDEILGGDDGEAWIAAASELSAEAALTRREQQGLVHQALGALPAEFREVLVLREFEDLSYREIALVLGIPMGTVMSRLSRARTMLARTILLEGKASR